MRTRNWKYRIQYRTSNKFPWHTIGPRPYGETHQFDHEGLFFDSENSAKWTMENMKRSNAAEFQVVEI